MDSSGQLKKLLNQDELEKELARRRFLDFTEFTFDDYQTNWHHRIMCETLDRFVAGEIPRLMVFCPPRHGKALEISTPVPTPDGWAKIGDLRPGDEVFSEDGSPTRVAAVSPLWTDRDLYAIKTKTGDKILADGEHIWKARLCRKYKAYRLHKTSDLASRQKRMTDFRAPAVSCHPGLSLPAKTLPIPPYTLGFWLGDGCSQSGYITSPTADHVPVLKRIEAEGFTARQHSDPRNWGILGLQKKLRACGLLGNKRIPCAYLRSSRHQRIALLHGLIDSDGHVAPDGQVEFCSVKKGLAEQVHELVVSLGVKAATYEGRATINGRDCGPKYRVCFYFRHAAHIPRKKERCRDVVKFPGHYIHVKKDGKGNTICIQVEHPSGMFLAGRHMVPTHNSELVSRRLPAYIFGQKPETSIIATSYSADLASMMNRDVQRIIDSDGYRRLFPKTALQGENIRTLSQGKWLRNSDLFEIVGTQRGRYRCAGVGGGVTGMGGDFILIDDPIKNHEEANSPTYRKKLWEWYTTTLYTRLEAKGSILLTVTRWHEDDLAGRLLEKAAADPKADQWAVLSFQAMQDQAFSYDDPRQEGAALWPEKKTVEDLEKIIALGGREFEALYQQNPIPAKGGMFQREDFEIIDVAPAKFSAVVRYWDRAATEGGGDYTVGAKVGLSASGLAIVLDVVRGQWGPDRVMQSILNTASQDGDDVTVGIEVDPGQAGKFEAAQYVKALGGYDVRLVPARDSKETRARPFAAQARCGNVKVLRGSWNNEWIEEHAAFPFGRHDDQADATSGAYMLCAGDKRKQQTNIKIDLSGTRVSPWVV